VLGLKLVMVGGGLVTVKLNALEVTLPGFVTVIEKVPNADMSAARIVAVS